MTNPTNPKVQQLQLETVAEDDKPFTGTQEERLAQAKDLTNGLRSSFEHHVQAAGVTDPTIAKKLVTDLHRAGVAYALAYGRLVKSIERESSDDDDGNHDDSG